jgi:hypothetical protein
VYETWVISASRQYRAPVKSITRASPVASSTITFEGLMSMCSTGVAPPICGWCSSRSTPASVRSTVSALTRGPAQLPWRVTYSRRLSPCRYSYTW